MKVTFINPSVGKVIDRPYLRSWSMEPLNIAVLSQLTPQKFEKEFFDDRFENIDSMELNTDLVAMPVETYTAKRAYSIADKIRKTGIPVVMGGVHAKLQPDEVMQHADYTIEGDGEYIWPQFLENFNKGESIPPRLNKKIDGRGILPQTIPDRSIYKQYPYIPIKLIETGRGCVFRCDFCSIAGQYDGSYRSKSIDAIIGEVASTPAKFHYFVDDNFVSEFNRTKLLCDRLTELNIHWFSQGSINMANDRKLLKSLSRSGCASILVGFESLNPENLKMMGKEWNTAKQNLEDSIRKFRDAGISLYATFVFGYDHDNLDDIHRTVEFAIKNKISMAAFNHIIPFPKTPLYSRLKEENRLIDDPWWLSETYRFGDVAFQPLNMSPEELADGCYKARNNFYSSVSIAKRMFDFKANSKNFFNSGATLYANLVSRKGVEERQSWPIGRIESKNEFENSRKTR